jgi:hypothetical protein
MADWFPEVGERVEVRRAAIAYSGARTTARYLGTVQSIDNSQEWPEVCVRMDNNPFGGRPWYVQGTVSEMQPIEEVSA